MKLTNKEFIKNIEKKYTFEKNPTVAVAVSGGPDSMSLLSVSYTHLTLPTSG